MKSGSFWFWLLILVILVAGVWYFGLFEKTRSFFIDFGKNPVLHQIEDSFSKSFSDPEKEPIGQSGELSVENLLKKTVAIPQKFVSQIIQKATDSAVESVKEQAGEAFDSLGQTIGLKSSGQINEPPLMVALNFSKNNLISFIVNGLEGDADFTVDWNDGERLSGRINAQEKKTIEHRWGKGGFYLVTAELKSKNGDVRKFSFPILIGE